MPRINGLTQKKGIEDNAKRAGEDEKPKGGLSDIKVEKKNTK